MATEIRDAAGDLLAYQLDHTAQQVDDCVTQAMIKAAYDPGNVVAQAGGIVAYINSLDAEEMEF